MFTILSSISGESVVKERRKTSELPDDCLDYHTITQQYRITENGLERPWSEKHLQLFNVYSGKYPKGPSLAELLTALQTTVQEICENVVLVDKLAFVREHQQQHHRRFKCELTKIFQDIVSPRCYALVIDKSQDVV